MNTTFAPAGCFKQLKMLPKSLSLHTVYLAEGKFVMCLENPQRPLNKYCIGGSCLGSGWVWDTSCFLKPIGLPRTLSASAEDHVFCRAVWLHKSLLGKTLNAADVLHTKELLHENKTCHNGN